MAISAGSNHAETFPFCALLKQDIDWDDIDSYELMLDKPILIHSDIEYTIQFELDGCVRSCRKLPPEVKLSSGLVVKFHSDTDPESIEMGLVEKLLFNLIE